MNPREDKRHVLVLKSFDKVYLHRNWWFYCVRKRYNKKYEDIQYKTFDNIDDCLSDIYSRFPDSEVESVCADTWSK